ncbi:MAG: FAD-dependent thymidylate synthase [Oscillospiraceae bacterium]|nr:FAD-dependent thymidylate synthase [Oscillospiraceae bacterium]
MKIIKAGYEILTNLDGLEILKHIERIGRVCYKSEDKITDNSCLDFVKMLLDRGHEAMIEHYSFSVKFICDRGVSHEIVRHRLAAFAQESTRYCNYSKAKFGNEITVIAPVFFGGGFAQTYDDWKAGCEAAETAYFKLLNEGAAPQEARSVLPNSLKTEIVMTANLREWRHFFKLRTADAAHPQMREIARPLLTELQRLIPVVFDDIQF